MVMNVLPPLSVVSDASVEAFNPLKPLNSNTMSVVDALLIVTFPDVGVKISVSGSEAKFSVTEPEPAITVLLLSRSNVENPLIALFVGDPAMLITSLDRSSTTDPVPPSCRSRVELPWPMKVLPENVRLPPAPPFRLWVTLLLIEPVLTIDQARSSAP